MTQLYYTADARAAGKIKLSIGGSYVSLIAVSNNEDSFGNRITKGLVENDPNTDDDDFEYNAGAEAVKSDYGRVNMVGDSEVIFRGDTTLDNGVRVDVIVELETDQANANNGVGIDESYIKIGNLKEWGEFRLGSTKQAHFIFKVNAPAVNTISNALNNDQPDRFLPNPTGTKFFNHDGSADHMKAVYITPNFNGFQAGISYTPGQDNTNAPPRTKGATATDTNDVSIGANYKGGSGGAGVAISGGWTRHAGANEFTTVQAGGSVSFAGFSIGGGWAQRSDDKGGSTAADIEGFMAGVGYETGPWSLALTWLNTEDDQTGAPGKDELNMYTLGAAYSLGGGVTVGASLFQAKYQDEDRTETYYNSANDAAQGDPANGTQVSTAQNNEGWGALAGIRVNF